MTVTTLVTTVMTTAVLGPWWQVVMVMMPPTRPLTIWSFPEKGVETLLYLLTSAIHALALRGPASQPRLCHMLL